jgi:two-component system sensor histidine kinase BaeS
MKRLFPILLVAFLLSLFGFLIILSAIFFSGFRRSATGWSSSARSSLEKTIEGEIRSLQYPLSGERLKAFRNRLAEALPEKIPLVVFDADMELIYRGGSDLDWSPGRMHRMGRGRPMGMPGMTEEGPVPVFDGSLLKGYYSLGHVGFGADRAASRFVDSMRRTMVTGVAAAFLLAVGVALVFTRKLSRSTESVAEGIDRISRGELNHRIDETRVREITIIAESANRLAEKLSQEENLRSQWAADIAHDLRTPITALKSQIEGMVDGVLDVSVPRMERNLRELERIERLVDDLAELTRLESPELRLNRERVTTARLIQELMGRFERQVREKSVALLWQDEVESMVVDESLAMRALSNLIDNAVRHTPDGGRIVVSLTRRRERIVVSVFNTGAEIPEKELDRVFDRLYRGEYARTSPGSGLGLTITARIAELHGGQMGIRNEPGKGVTVIMQIGEED